MNEENGSFQFEASGPDWVRKIPFFVEGPWRCSDDGTGFVVDRRPVNRWVAAHRRGAAVVGRERSGAVLHGVESLVKIAALSPNKSL